MLQLLLAIAASTLMLAQASAHTAKVTRLSDKDGPQTAWSSGRVASVTPSTVVGENCYVDWEPAIDEAGRTYLKAEAICD